MCPEAVGCIQGLPEALLKAGNDESDQHEVRVFDKHNMNCLHDQAFASQALSLCRIMLAAHHGTPACQNIQHILGCVQGLVGSESEEESDGQLYGEVQVSIKHGVKCLYKQPSVDVGQALQLSCIMPPLHYSRLASQNLSMYIGLHTGVDG